MWERTSVWGIYSDPLTVAYENSVYGVVAHQFTEKSLQMKMRNDMRVMKKKKEKYTSIAYVLTNNENNISERCSMLLGKDQAND